MRAHAGLLALLLLATLVACEKSDTSRCKERCLADTRCDPMFGGDACLRACDTYLVPMDAGRPKRFEGCLNAGALGAAESRCIAALPGAVEADEPSTPACSTYLACVGALPACVPE